MSEINPDNKCAQLWNQEVPDLNGQQSLNKIFEMQNSLQLRLGQDFSKMTLQERTHLIMNNWNYLTGEYVELLERLPFKSWKSYSPEQKVDFQSEEEKLETWYEWCDCLHFFINIGLLLGIDGDTAWKLYAQKNKENFARQDRGY
jgi:dimeric dUTPase (all-alpha-NTP-PPase superfamily)